MSKRALRPLVLLAAVLVLTSIFITLLLLAFPDPLTTHLNDILVLTGAFLFSLIFAIGMIWGVFKTFAQHFYSISADAAGALVSRLVFGGGEAPLLEVQAGRVNLEGSVVLRQVGGPGSLHIDHDSVVVTERLSRLHRVLGPGTHSLEPFEKIWDVVDLRPQRRSVHVEFMTRDGIPVHCDAVIRFRVGGGHTNATHNYAYADRAVRDIITLHRVSDATGTEALQDWITHLTKNILVGEIRTTLEQYSLDEFLNPRYWLAQPAAPSPQPRAIIELEADIFTSVQQRGENLGIAVESVQLGPVLPAEGAISQQWLEFWQARLQRLVDESLVEGEAVYQSLVSQAQINAKTELLTAMLSEVQDLTQRSVDVPAESIVLSFFDALRAIAKRDPIAQQVLLKQVDALINIARGIT